MSVLEKPCLVLNRNWVAVNVATLADALVMLWKGAANVVDVNDYSTFTWQDWAKVSPEDGDRFIQTTSLKLRIPEVVVLTGYDGLPETSVTFSRRNIFKRDKVCQYCGCQPASDEATIDHVMPRSRFPEIGTTWENCVLSCIKCNKKKGQKLPSECGMFPKKKPIRPAWRPIYASRILGAESWQKFISEAYWNIELER